MVWTAWNNGQHHESGAGYGFKVPAPDRDAMFARHWNTVILELPNGVDTVIATANIDKDSFWTGDCRELISQTIGTWLRGHDYAPWPPRDPPKFEVTHVNGFTFRVVRRLP